MSMETEKEGVSSNLDEQEDLPQATVISSDAFNAPEVKAWKFANLEEQAKQEHQKIRDDVLEKLRKEVLQSLHLLVETTGNKLLLMILLPQQ